MESDILERAKKADIDLMAITDWGQLRDLFGELIAEVGRLRSLENCVSLVIDRQGKTNAALLGQLDVISAYLDAELVEWKNGDQIAEIAIKFMDLQKQKLNDANSQIAAKDARIDLLDSDQKRYHAAWMAAEEDKEEQAARIKELEAEVEAKNKQIKELQDIIDKPPEDADWVADYHLLQSALDGPIIDAARKWHAAYRKAQNSNLMRAKEVERLRAENRELKKTDVWANDVIKEHESLNARIKELEEANRNIDKRRDEMAAFIERLEAAFLKLYVNQLVGCNMPREVAEKHAREALERIKEESEG